ncbi:hypothetical protein NPIL_572471 [Nephila pilipes]|uniref:Uncharacterized protein n=1 Tax=Nephila pilipes TaxID=299642 RepID=A0A8X6TC66_NEPPI|nr:hypothetical protein NPIL_572471 [Nephila pilipes]
MSLLHFTPSNSFTKYLVKLEDATAKPHKVLHRRTPSKARLGCFMVSTRRIQVSFKSTNTIRRRQTSLFGTTIEMFLGRGYYRIKIKGRVVVKGWQVFVYALRD